MADVGAIGTGGDNSFLATQGYDFFSNAGYPLTGVVSNEAQLVTGQESQYQVSKLCLGDAVLSYLASAQTYHVSGIVEENGVAVSGRLVRVFNRANGVLLGEVMSGALGVFSIPILGFNGEVTVLAYDNDTGDSFNVRVFDRVIPV